MFPNGHPDPPTLINLGYYDPVEELPAAQRRYVEGGDRPSTFFRDLGTASNQVPQWGWIALGAGLLLFGYWTYHQSKAPRAKT
jgi:hypothetical protein